MTLVTEEHAIRGIATMAEQTTGFEFGELLLPENFLEKYKDPMTPDESDETGEGNAKPGEESDRKDNSHGKGKGKGKAREKGKKPAKPASDTEDDEENEPEPEPPGRVLNNLVSRSYPCPCFWTDGFRRSKEPTR